MERTLQAISSPISSGINRQVDVPLDSKVALLLSINHLGLMSF